MQLEDFLCKKLSITKKDLNSFLLLAPNKYKVYTIPKRTSGKRVIAHPAKKLKLYQRALLEYLETILKIHPAAYAYRKGLGIKDNAKCHQNGRYLLKMDFQSFFHSISPKIFFVIIEKLGLSISQENKDILTQLLFWRPSKSRGGKLVLSIGAPSSPFVSNSIMYLFDDDLETICKKQGIRYTRYADDLTFSTNVKGALFDMPILVKDLLLHHLDGYVSINEKKTVFTSKAHNRHVTGVTLTNEGMLSIGRKKKRYISSLIHKYTMGKLPVEDLAYLQGLLSFAYDIEADFITRMEKKYSKDIVSQLCKGIL